LYILDIFWWKIGSLPFQSFRNSEHPKLIRRRCFLRKKRLDWTISTLKRCFFWRGLDVHNNCLVIGRRFLKGERCVNLLVNSFILVRDGNVIFHSWCKLLKIVRVGGRIFILRILMAVIVNIVITPFWLYGMCFIHICSKTWLEKHYARHDEIDEDEWRNYIEQNVYEDFKLHFVS